MVGKINGKCRYKRKGYLLDLVGERFGRLVVTAKAEDKIDPKSGKHKSQWYCDCDCGTKNKIILGAALTAGKIRSCGCLRKEVSSKTAKIKISHGKKYNTYDLSGEYGIGYDSNGNKFFFDLEDYNLIKDICWHKTTKGYFAGHIIGDDKREVKMHRLILKMEDYGKDTIVCDHIYSNRKYDNRKKNLRITEQKNNVKNRVRSSNNTSGKVGVSWNKNSKKWYAYIGIDNKQISLGYYTDIQDAIDARVSAEKRYFGEYRVKNEH